MIGLLRYLALALAAALALGIPAPSAVAATPARVADNRCNGQMIDDASARVRDYDRRGDAGNTAQLLQRFGAIADVIAVLNEEREILDSICSSDEQRAPLFAQIAATSAWALTLEADIAARLNSSCPAAQKALPAMMLADAWLALANIINENKGTVPDAFSGVIPRIQTRAQAVGLTLPAWSETSAYWRDQVRAASKATIASCPSPSPVPSPTGSPPVRPSTGSG
jgi:hypothetical protein